MDRTEEDTPKRHERPLKRQLNSHSHLLGAKVTVQMYPSPSLFGSSVNYVECFGWKTKIENYNQFSIFTLPLKTEKLSHATDCNIVGKAKLPLCFIFPFIVDRIKLKI